jgi:hypothetical protein
MNDLNAQYNQDQRNQYASGSGANVTENTQPYDSTGMEYSVSKLSIFNDISTENLTIQRISRLYNIW